jgi:hypothetical protein
MKEQLTRDPIPYQKRLTGYWVEKQINVALVFLWDKECRDSGGAVAKLIVSGLLINIVTEYGLASLQYRSI